MIFLMRVCASCRRRHNHQATEVQLFEFFLLSLLGTFIRYSLYLRQARRTVVMGIMVADQDLQVLMQGRQHIERKSSRAPAVPTHRRPRHYDMDQSY